MSRLPLLGDEAIAQGALDAGISGIYAYPGTPSTEILEYVQRSREVRSGRKVHCTWSSNEKTAMETALGMSYAGKRAMVCMKHVGLNVAADPFLNSAITGANGGLIIVAADDPSMHSSQNEQDSRFYGNFAMIPMLEPSSQQEAYEMTHYGFELSERNEIPVLLRITTRLAHSRAGVKVYQSRAENDPKLPDNLRQFVLLPAIARKQYQLLLNKQTALEKESEKAGWNAYTDGTDKSFGIIVSGIALNYLNECYSGSESPYPVLKIGQYPLPKILIERIVSECKVTIVIEEGYPFIEEALRGLLNKSFKVKGRLDGTLPRTGELSPLLVAKALGMPQPDLFPVPSVVAGRPPKLCPGCPHIDSFNALNEALAEVSNGVSGNVMSDIGCYTLGALKPFESINSCVDMGASITMAKGISDAGIRPAVAVIGDSTFTHSGMTGLLDCVVNKTPVTIIILDNEATAMTGGQISQASGRLEDICKGIGVEEEHIIILNPLRKHHSTNVGIIKQELNYEGVSVIIPRRECIVTLAQKKKK